MAKVGLSTRLLARVPATEDLVRRALAKGVPYLDIDATILPLVQTQPPRASLALVTCRLSTVVDDALAVARQPTQLHNRFVPLVPADLTCASELPALLSGMQRLADASIIGSYGVYVQTYDAGLASRVDASAGPHLKWIQTPLNPFERNLVTDIAPWAKAKGVRLIASRPLTCVSPQGGSRLVDGAFPLDYGLVKDSLLNHVAGMGEAGTWLSNLVANIDRQLDLFESSLHWQAELTGRILPMIDDAFEAMDADTYDMLVAFFDRFGKAVKESASARARLSVAAQCGGEEPAGDLQRWAAEWAAAHDDVAFVAVDGEADEFDWLLSS